MDKRFETYYDKDSKTTLSKTKYVPVQINYFIGKKRFEKVPDESDLKVIEKCNSLEKEIWIPINEIPDGDKSRETLKKGYNRVNQLFTNRNLIVLSEF